MIKYIRGLKIFSLIALFCTIILWLGLWGFSLVPSDQSGSMTDKVTGVVDSALGVQDKIDGSLATQSVQIIIEDEKNFYFLDETPQATIKFSPEETKDTEVVYEIFSTAGDGEAEVDENGKITFIEKGLLTLKVSLKSNPDIYDLHGLTCYGENPTDPLYPERKTVTIGGETENITLHVGEKQKITVNHGKTSLSSVKISVENSDIMGYSSGVLYPRKVGSTTIGIKFSDGEKKVIDISVEQGDVPQIPDFVFADDITLIHNETIDKMSLLVIPESADLDLFECLVTSSDSDIIKVHKNSKLRIVGYGEVTLTYTPAFAPDKKVSITLNVSKTNPDLIQIIGKDKIMPGQARYSAKLYPIDYEDDVVWSVVKGKATIDQNGLLTANSYGTVVVRCQSTLNPELYQDKEIKVTLYTSAYMFVRKLMGHAGLSALLGFGLIGTLFLLCRKKYNCVFAVPLAFAYAGISELLQKFAPGRYCLMTDVLVDFIGTLVGMAVAVVSVTVVTVLWRLIDKNSFGKLVKVYKMQNFTNVFKKSSDLEKLYFEIEPDNKNTPATESENETDISATENNSDNDTDNDFENNSENDSDNE